MLNLEREKRFHELLVAALDREPGERHRFLAESCKDDGGLLEELRAATAQDDGDLEGFLDSPVLALPPVTQVARSRARSAEIPAPTAPSSIAGRLRAERERWAPAVRRLSRWAERPRPPRGRPVRGPWSRRGSPAADSVRSA